MGVINWTAATDDGRDSVAEEVDKPVMVGIDRGRQSAKGMLARAVAKRPKA